MLVVSRPRRASKGEPSGRATRPKVERKVAHLIVAPRRWPRLRFAWRRRESQTARHPLGEGAADGHRGAGREQAKSPRGSRPRPVVSLGPVVARASSPALRSQGVYRA